MEYGASADPAELTLKVGESSKITAVGQNVTLINISWSSSNSEAVSVDSEGGISVLKYTESPVTISFAADGKNSEDLIVGSYQGSCVVTVSPQATIALGTSQTDVLLGTPSVVSIIVSNKSAQGVLSAESADSNVVQAQIKDNEVVLTGISTGNTTVTVKYTEGDYTVSAVLEVEVKYGEGTDPREDHTTALKDKDGNQLYVLDNNEYRQAYAADYYTFEKFYKQTAVKYTGWQTIDGQLRFYDKYGVQVKGKQIIQGMEYDFGEEGFIRKAEAIMGIDVSKWNGDIDWQAVKNSGVSYVIIRCGYRGSSKGALIEDPKFKENLRGAKSVNVGVYFFTQAIDQVEAVEEASMVLNLLDGTELQYPIFLDVEPSGGRADGISVKTRTEVCKAFCATIQSGGYKKVGIYANTNWFTEKINTSSLNQYYIWLAQYASKPTYTGKYDIWQYKKTGKVAGIDGDVDLNLSYLGY